MRESPSKGSVAHLVSLLVSIESTEKSPKNRADSELFFISLISTRVVFYRSSSNSAEIFKNKTQEKLDVCLCVGVVRGGGDTLCVCSAAVPCSNRIKNQLRVGGKLGKHTRRDRFEYIESGAFLNSTSWNCQGIFKSFKISN